MPTKITGQNFIYIGDLDPDFVMEVLRSNLMWMPIKLVAKEFKNAEVINPTQEVPTSEGVQNLINPDHFNRVKAIRISTISMEVNE